MTESLLRFIKQLEKEKATPVYTYSKRIKTIEEELNKIDKYTRYFLSTYACQEWAMGLRHKLGISIRSLLKVDMFFGIDPNGHPLKNQIYCLIETREVIESLKKIFNDKMFTPSEKLALKVAFCNTNKDLNSVMFKKHFSSAIKKISKTYSSYFKEKYKNISTFFKKMDNETLIVCHDSKTLLKLYKQLNTLPIERDFDENGFKSQMRKCFVGLNQYKFNKDVNVIMRELYVNNLTWSELQQKLKKTKNYINYRYKEGVMALNIVIWGYYSDLYE